MDGIVHSYVFNTSFPEEKEDHNIQLTLIGKY